MILKQRQPQGFNTDATPYQVIDAAYHRTDAYDPEMLYKDKYNTPLSEQEQIKFQQWLKDESVRRGRNVSMDMGAYDVQGFWKSGGTVGADGHSTDLWKKPNHPTFSNESKYHGVDGSYGGVWGNHSYKPSKQTLELYGPRRIAHELSDGPDRLNLDRFESGENRPSPLVYKIGGILKNK